MIDTAIRTYLLAQATVTNIVGTSGVYVDRIPQNTAVPHVVVTQVGGNPEQHSGGASDLRRADITVECYAGGTVAAGTLADAVEAALAGEQATMGSFNVRSCIALDKRRDTEPPAQGDQTGFPRVTVTFEVFYKPAV